MSTENDGFISGVIKNCETGEERSFRHYLCVTDAYMKAYVKVECTSSYTCMDNSMEVSIDCLALGALGDVFELGVNFLTTTKGRDKIIQDLKTGSIWLMEGDLSVFCEDGVSYIILYLPEYKKLPPEIETEAAIAFKENYQNEEET